MFEAIRRGAAALLAAAGLAIQTSLATAADRQGQLTDSGE
jgi:hypothetical protein